MNYRTRIIGTGIAHPVGEMPNSEFEKIVDTSDEWIQSRTGIKTRRIADPKKGETTGLFALNAAKQALESAKLDGSEIELILVGTITADTVMPTTANMLQAQLGAHGAFGFDLQAACAGFLYGLSVADHYIRAGTVKNALVVGVETLSQLTNWSDRSTCVLFGDGAGAVVVQRTDSLEHAILSTKLHSDGRHAKLLHIEHGYGKVPPYAAEYRHQDRSIKMHGAEVFKLATRNMVDSATATLKEHGYTVKDVDFAIFHQANIRIIDHCLKTLDLPYEKTWINVDKYGNTSAATLPTALHEAWRAGKVKSGDLVLMATFGGGLTWGSTLIRL